MARRLCPECVDNDDLCEAQGPRECPRSRYDDCPYSYSTAACIADEADDVIAERERIAGGHVEDWGAAHTR